ncbi:tyrosine-protein phosphatase non-receptor type 4-like [Aquarana catesbeiana]|uniref:tyrosine-protein phosphatase non-receptor type 4-like n=1 Tax=Aquarana catesbeiana TaxID=8400 RepID=UPI003CC9F3D1
MSARFRLPAGKSYNVRASEQARDRQSTEVVCNILLLDNTVQAFRVSKHEDGQALLDLVFKFLDLTERDYFGLQLADDSSENPKWLDPNKLIRKQLKRGSPHSLNFRVKFFVSDSSKLQEEYTRYLYFLQIKQDILTGRLPCPYSTATLLASYAVQCKIPYQTGHVISHLCPSTVIFINHFNTGALAPHSCPGQLSALSHFGNRGGLCSQY